MSSQNVQQPILQQQTPQVSAAYYSQNNGVLSQANPSAVTNTVQNIPLVAQIPEQRLAPLAPAIAITQRVPQAQTTATPNVEAKVPVNQMLNMIDFRSKVDVCFVVDMSEHMASHFIMVRRNIDAFMQFVSTDPTIHRWRVAFVGYRDYEDVPNQFMVQPFTRDSGIPK